MPKGKGKSKAAKRSAGPSVASGVEPGTPSSTTSPTTTVAVKSATAGPLSARQVNALLSEALRDFERQRDLAESIVVREVASMTIQLIRLAENIVDASKERNALQAMLCRITDRLLRRLLHVNDEALTADTKMKSQVGRLKSGAETLQKELEQLIASKTKLVPARVTENMIFYQLHMKWAEHAWEMPLKKPAERLRVSMKAQRRMTTHFAHDEFIEPGHVAGPAHHDCDSYLMPIPDTPTKNLLPPPAPLVFHGREDLVTHILDLVIDGQKSNAPARVPILGSSGMGKTAIALTVVSHERVKKLFGNNRHWIPCYQTPTVTLMLEHLARTLLVAGRTSDRLVDIRSHLIAHQEPRIVVLDNFETLWDEDDARPRAETILAFLKPIKSLTLIITMGGKARPAIIPWTPLSLIKPLSPNAARQTFCDIAPQYVNDVNLHALLEALDYVPLAVVLAATVCKSSLLSLSGLLEDATASQTVAQVDQSDQLPSVEMIIRLALRSPPMLSNPDALILLSTLAHLPGGIRPGIIRDVAPEISDHDAARDTLKHIGLAYLTVDSTLQLLPSIRSYILHHQPLSDPQLLALRRFYFSVCRRARTSPTHESFTQIVQTMAEEADNLEWILSSTLETAATFEAVRACLDYAAFLYINTPRVEMLFKALDAVQNGPDPDGKLRECTSVCQQRLGEALIKLSDYGGALKLLEKAREGHRAHGAASEDGGQIMLAQCSISLGSLYRLEGRHEDAAEALSEALGWFRAVGDVGGATHALSSLGNVYRLQRKYDLSIETLEQAMEELKTLGDEECVALCLQSLGEVYHSRGKYSDAAQYFTEARTLFETLDNYLGAAQALRSLGDVSIVANQHSAALPAFLDSLSIFRALGHEMGIAQCLLGIGHIYALEGRHAEALVALGEGKKRFRALEKMEGENGASVAMQGARECVRLVIPVYLALGMKKESKEALDEVVGLLKIQSEIEEAQKQKDVEAAKRRLAIQEAKQQPS